MKTYYLYRLVNSLKFDKCGATVEWDRRLADNIVQHGSQSIITLLETMEGPNTPEYWQVVGDREWQLADEYGYPRGTHYKVAREKRQPTQEQLSLGGRNGGAIGGPVTVALGIGIHGMSDAEKKAAQSKGGKASVNTMRSYLTKEALAKGGAAGKGKPKPKTECPHCKKMIANHVLNRFHNDNCKLA